MILADPGRLWFLSTRLHVRGWRRTARLLKAYNFLVFHAVLPPEARLVEPVTLGHFGLNIVVHPNVSIGKRVHIWHGVTIAVSDSPGSSSRVTLDSDITIGTGAVIVSREKQSMHICSGVKIGANSVVSRSIAIPGTYLGRPAELHVSGNLEPKR